MNGRMDGSVAEDGGVSCKLSDRARGLLTRLLIHSNRVAPVYACDGRVWMIAHVAAVARQHFEQGGVLARRHALDHVTPGEGARRGEVR